MVSLSARPTESKIEFQLPYSMSHRREATSTNFQTHPELGFTASIAAAVHRDCIEILLKDSLKAEPSVA